ncbi:phage tail protein [Aeromonas caviae]|uniref:phage tail-collar fiber domain-containing protein n=1 Tax=Aeromonas caviae TaxID=648 RepID=UPI0030151E99
MSQVITNAFEQYWQSSLAAEQPVVLDEFILADIPNLDITSPIDPDAGLPPESQIVHRQNVDQRGRINNNAVAYTIVMDTTVGDFSFNAMYLRNKQNGVIGMIVYKGRETKLKTDQTTGQTGNSLVKSMLMGYDQAAEATLTQVDAGTWQIDYAARLRGQDEDLRQLASQLYGHHTFIGDGFKVVQQDGNHQVTPGVAIVGGLRVELKQPEVIYPGTKPIGVWVDVHRAGSLLSEHQNLCTIITSVADLTDHVDGSGYQHFVAKLGIVQADNTVVDSRGITRSDETSIPESLYLLEQADAKLTITSREALRRACAEAGYTLVDGSFGLGGKLNSVTDVLLDEASGKVYVRIGSLPYTVPEKSVPDEGFSDRSIMLLPSLSTQILSIEAGQRIRGISPQKTSISAPVGVLDYAGGRFDNLELSGFEFIGPGRNHASGTIAIRRDGTQSSNREKVEAVNFTQYPVGVLHSAGWGQDYNRLVFTKCGTGFETTASPIEAGWAGSGYVMENCYFGGCDLGLRDDYIWNATYINLIIEDCGAPYIQNTAGSTTVMINPWFEDNTNPIQWRRGTVTIGGRGVEYADVQLWSGRPYETMVDISRGGIKTFRTDYDNPEFWIDGQGLKRLKTVFSETGWEFKDNLAATAKLLKVGLGGGVTAESSSNNSTEVVLTKLTGKYHYWSANLAAMPEMGVEVRGKTANGGAGRGLVRVVFSTGQYENVGNVNNLYGDRWAVEINGNFAPQVDNTFDVGSASLRGRVAYFGTGTINTSDAREKTAPLPIDDAVLDAWGDVQLITFQWLESIRLKGGDDARWHFGVIAQQVRDTFAAHGLDGCRYGLLCYDEWEDVFEPVFAKRDMVTVKQRPIGDTNELEDYEDIEQEEYDTGEVRQTQIAGSRWGIRPDQCLFLEAAYQRRRCDRIEARLASLEAR